MKRKIFLIFKIVVAVSIITFLFTNVHIRTSKQKYFVDDYEISIVVRECINCLWLDPTIKKRVYIKENNKNVRYNLNRPKLYWDLNTRIVIGRSKSTSKFKEKGIDEVVFFPSSNEIMETYDYITGCDLNKIEDGFFIRHNYYKENQIHIMKNELELSLDTILEFSRK